MIMPWMYRNTKCNFVHMFIYLYIVIIMHKRDMADRHLNGVAAWNREPDELHGSHSDAEKRPDSTYLLISSMIFVSLDVQMMSP